MIVVQANRRRPEGRDERIAAARLAGETYGAIAAREGISRERVRGLLERFAYECKERERIRLLAVASELALYFANPRARAAARFAEIHFALEELAQ